MEKSSLPKLPVSKIWLINFGFLGVKWPSPYKVQHEPYLPNAGCESQSGLFLPSAPSSRINHPTIDRKILR